MGGRQRAKALVPLDRGDRDFHLPLDYGASLSFLRTCWGPAAADPAGPPPAIVIAVMPHPTTPPLPSSNQLIRSVRRAVGSSLSFSCVGGGGCGGRPDELRDSGASFLILARRKKPAMSPDDDGGGGSGDRVSHRLNQHALRHARARARTHAALRSCHALAHVVLQGGL